MPANGPVFGIAADMSTSATLTTIESASDGLSSAKMVSRAERL
jgi:hypothetical protein